MQKHLDTLSKKTKPAVRIEVLGTGQELFSRNEDEKMIPASNAKLITAMAALEKLGPGYTFETKVLKQGNDLVIASNGDPFLVSERLWLLAREVARSGIKKVGSIRVNNGAFDETYRGLTDFQGSGEPFTALVAATSLNFNSLEVHVIPQPGSAKPRLEAGPVNSSYVKWKNEVVQNGGSGKNISVRPLGDDGQSETFVVSGSIGKNAEPVIVYGTVSNPEAHIAAAFAALLRQEGITVGKDFGGVESGPVKGDTVAKLESLPLQDLVRLFNTYSNNFMAEEIFLALGSAGGGTATVAKSQTVVSDFLAKHPACAGAKMLNGSGLHWDTRLSARCFTQTIQDGYRDFRVFADLLGSFPAGKETGSVKHRFRSLGQDFEALKVRAKTGTLWSRQAVSSLTGVTSAASGEKVVFSLIENDQRNNPELLRELKDWEDRCLELVQKLRL